MTTTDIARIVEAANGVLTQDALRAHTGSYQVIQQWLAAQGLAVKSTKGRRQYWKLALPLAETLTAIRALPVAEVTRAAVKCTRRTADDRAVFHSAARHWQVVYDPEERFTTQARFGYTELRGPNHTWAEWLVEGMTLRHDGTGAEMCFYQGRMQKL